MQKLTPLLVVSVLFATPAVFSVAGEKSDELAGKWKVDKAGGANFGLKELKADPRRDYTHFVSVVTNGKELDIKNGKLYASVPKGKDVDLKFTRQSDKKPHRIVAKNKDDQIVFHGICQLEMDTLVLCITLESRPIPTEFKNAPPDSRLIRLVRVKK